MDFNAARIRTILGKLKEWTFASRESLDGFEYVECGYKTDNTFPTDGWKPCTEAFCAEIKGIERHFWFSKQLKTPKTEKGQSAFFSLKTGKEGHWDATNPQGLVYLNGKMVQGLDVNHTEVLLEPDTEYDLKIYFYSGRDEAAFRFIPSLYVQYDEVEALWYDIWVAYSGAMCFDENDDNYLSVIKELNAAMLLLDLRVPKSNEFLKSVASARKYLKNNFYGKLCGKSPNVVNCIGHTHIDVAWLWTLAQTREKAQRSFSTVLNLMKQYPEYKFMSSQPQLYKFTKEEAPELYEEIKERVKEGRWEVEGAMWLEADCNLTSGESLVRQIMHGKRFMKEEFGVDSRVLWLPDVFGYSAALPQILKKCGVDHFVTSKISWNQHNQMPYDTFMWQGIDGTEILTNFMTAQDHQRGRKPYINTTYNGYPSPQQVYGTWERYQQKDYNNETVITFGHGDGGGGPTRDMLEQQRRTAYGLPGIPKTQISFAGDYLERVKKNFEKYSKECGTTPRWVGELYLEMHRGTYTSIAKNKKNNRKSELMYQRTEGLSTMATKLLGAEYPHNVINDGWETILLNQFHDIIPGSSIFEVYEDSDKQYAEILKTAADIKNGALAKIAGEVASDGGVLVYNPLSFTASGMVEASGKQLWAKDVPAFGWTVIDENSTGCSVSATEKKLENKYYIVKFDKNGDITSIYDKERKRELIAKGGKANQLQVFEDYPMEYDAWEISPYYKDKMWLVGGLEATKVINEGVRAGIEQTRKYGNSNFVQKIYLYEDSRRIDFVTDIDWNEDHVLLKAAFPLDVHANEFTCDIQFGHAKRPTHRNTSWDEAKFEVCAQKWADMSEGDFGVALLNDCKYGYSAEGNVIKLSLLKAATYPNHSADREHHSFTYSLFAHDGAQDIENVVKEAYLLNQPMEAVEVKAQGGTLSDTYSFVSCNRDDVIIETVKESEDGNATVMRMYESANKRGEVCLTLGFDAKEAYICDMLENELEKIKVENGKAKFNIKPFEIVTVKFV